jgi:epsilon-lactone hydrolase
MGVPLMKKAAAHLQSLIVGGKFAAPQRAVFGRRSGSAAKTASHQSSRKSLLLLLACWVACIVIQAEQRAAAQANIAVDKDGTVHMPAYEMPLSIYMSDEAKKAYVKRTLDSITLEPPKTRADLDRLWAPLLERAKALYPVIIAKEWIAGIPVYVVTPKEGVTQQNRNHVLVNLHGGGFVAGRGTLQLIESIPIASTGAIKVISVDYRMAPEYKFPAASEDVAAVYRELLKKYMPQSIGIYGCSAGGMLTAMSLAWFQKEKLPRPGAAGIFCAADSVWGGDSIYSAAPLDGEQPHSATPNPPLPPLPYLAGVNLKDPLVSPTLHPEILRQFPPTLLITGTRDGTASTVIYAHSQLVRVGVEAELHVWDGMWHSFFMDVDIPESREMYEVTARFFATHLGTTR